MIIALSFMCVSSFVGAEEQPQVAQKMNDCSDMSMDMQTFANQLSSSNKRMFCGQFNNRQRTQAMQTTGQKDASGNMMSADQAVQKVAADSNMTPAKTPSGCPVK